MEALTAVGLASNVVQFISFTREVISTSRQITGDAGGLVTNLELEAIAKNLKHLSSQLTITRRDPIKATEDHALRTGVRAAVELSLRRGLPALHDNALWKDVTAAVADSLPKDIVFTVDRELHDGILFALDQAQYDGVKAGDLATPTKDVKDFRLRINIAVDQALQEGAQSTEDKDLRKLCDGCQYVASSLLEKMQKLRNSGMSSARMPKKWASFREALATVMSADKIAEMEARMDRYQRGINIALLASLRKQVAEAQKTNAARDERMSERLLGFIDDTKSWQADLIDTLHRDKWQPNNPHDTEQLAYRLTVGAGLDAQQLNQQRIHQLLQFDEISDRHETITEAHKDTFRWVYHRDHQSLTEPTSPDDQTVDTPAPQYNNFADWILSDQQVYWITGKPGSGKSTLVKYLAKEPETRRLATQWSGGRELITAQYFFWNSGTRMQMSKMGLLQTLLYQCLQGRTALIPSLFGNRWKNYMLFGADVRPWSWPELTQALEALFSVTDYCLLLFIDGLDEFESDPGDLVSLILDWTELSSDNVKLCVSSRPWLVFEESFKDAQWLRMEDLTRHDIQSYVETHMSESSQWQMLQKYNAQETEKIVEEITEKAVGVFLWVMLVVTSLLSGLRDGDSIEQLWTRLHGLPSRLEALFQKILSGLNPEYFVQACQMFQLVLTAFDPPTLLEMSFAHDGVNPSIEALLGPMSAKELKYRAETMRRRITSRSKGLLEAPRISVDGEAAKVEYLHRTVRDFFQGPEAWTYIRSGAPKFNAPLLLAASSLRMVKMTPLVHRASVFDQFWRATASCIEYSRKCEESIGIAPVSILDELDMTGYVYWNREPLHRKAPYKNWMDELVDESFTRTNRQNLSMAETIQREPSFTGHRDTPLWQNTIHLCAEHTFFPVINIRALTQDWALTSFFDLMFTAGVKSYVFSKVTKDIARSHQIHSISRRRSLDLLALSIEAREYALAKRLIDHGADPNARNIVSGTTWSHFLDSMRKHQLGAHADGSLSAFGGVQNAHPEHEISALIKAFVDNGADPGYLCPGDFDTVLHCLDGETVQSLRIQWQQQKRSQPPTDGSFLSVDASCKQDPAPNSLRMVLRRKFKSWSGS